MKLEEIQCVSSISCSLFYCVKMTRLGFIVPFFDLGNFFAYSSIPLKQIVYFWWVLSMVSDGLLREFSQLLLKHSVSLGDIMAMVYSKDELDPLTGKYKKYFDLTTVNRDTAKYPEGFTYKVRYKLDLSGNRIQQGKATYTTKTAAIDEAVKLGFDNRFEVLKLYELNKDKPKGGSIFFKMLTDYYTDGSKYLQDDVKILYLMLKIKYSVKR
jgi:hypothetical protein